MKAYIWPNFKISEKNYIYGAGMSAVTNLDQVTNCTSYLNLKSCCRQVPSTQISIYIFNHVQ